MQCSLWYKHLKCPVRALIGPWSHSWPTDSSPGPRIDHLKECLRWFDYQLKGLPTGVMDEPVLRLFLRDGMFCNCMHICPSSFIITEVDPGDFRVGGWGWGAEHFVVICSTRHKNNMEVIRCEPHNFQEFLYLPFIIINNN